MGCNLFVVVWAHVMQRWTAVLWVCGYVVCHYIILYHSVSTVQLLLSLDWMGWRNETSFDGAPSWRRSAPHLLPSFGAVIAAFGVACRLVVVSPTHLLHCSLTSHHLSHRIQH